MDAMTRRMRFSAGEGTLVQKSNTHGERYKAKGNLCYPLVLE